MADINYSHQVAPVVTQNFDDATAMTIDFDTDDAYRPYTIAVNNVGSGTLAVHVDGLHKDGEYFAIRGSDRNWSDLTSGYKTPHGTVGQIGRVKVYVASGFFGALQLHVVERGSAP